MDINRVGKFEALKIVNDFDQALIEMFGLNMTDAHIMRFDALAAFAETGNVKKAAELLGLQRGLRPIEKPAT
ncbi:MAG: hypothetical protein KGZ43_02725 [Sulfuritalea sp.]|nr:hypothetical protein [Sulfuritalea sp.]